jgi:chorismate mutase-like protein
VRDLSEYRSQIDAIDQQVIELLGRRFDVCRRVAEHKRAEAIPMMQPGRVQEVLARAARRGEANGVPGAFMRSLYELIIGEACRLEDEIIGDVVRSA